jgi:LCP family protein required for cell wall assembly
MSARAAHIARRALLGVSAALALLAGSALGALVYLDHQLDDVDRIPGVFVDIGPRPERVRTGTAAEAVNILLLGTDRRSEVSTTGSTAEAASWVYGAQRSDATMLVHVDGDREHVTVISLPRDSWVAVPGYGMAKINAAYSYGGPALAVRTVEQLTGVHIDHLAVIDWDGFHHLIDAVGGIDVTVPETVYDAARDVTWTAGVHHLDGDQALDYVGQRYGLPGGDLDRVRRQQAVLRTLAEQTLGLRDDPAGIIDFVNLLTDHLSVDEDWGSRDLASLAWSLRHLGGEDVRCVTAPVRGLGWAGQQSVVWLDRAEGAHLWRALRNDRVDQWAAAHPQPDDDPS